MAREDELEERVAAGRAAALLDALNDAVLVHDLSGRFLDVNAAACRQLGYSRAELLDRALTDILAPESALEAAQHVEWASRKDGLLFETTYMARSGGRIPVEVSSQAIGYDGRPAILNVARDITLRKQAEEVLRESEERYHAFFEQAADSIVLVDASTGELVEFNDRAHEMLGYGREEFAKLKLADLEAIESVEEVAEHVEKIVTEGADSFETKQRTKGGQIRDVHVSARAIHIRGRTFLQAIWRDITDRKRAEEALRLTQFSIDRTADLAFWTGPDGRFVYVNDSACRSLGYSRQELLSMAVHDVDPDFPPEVWADHWGMLKQQGVLSFESRHRRKDGRVFPVHVTLNYGEFGGKEYNFAFTRDITEIRQKEEELRQAQKAEAIGRLAGGIAHDFNNQLTVIQGYCDLLLARGAEGSSSRDELQEIRDAAERAHRLTDQLLAFSRKQMLNARVTNLNDILLEMEDPLSRMIGEDIRLSIIPEPSLGNVRVDRSQVEQAVINMAVNARDAMPDGGGLTIETANVELGAQYVRRHPEATAGEYVMLAVSDTGQGMDDGTMGQIFEPFFTTKEVGKGTGLGLSMVYGFVRQSGGSIQVYSEPGVGTTLKVYLPRVHEPEEEPLRAPPAGPSPKGTETILVAEDDRAVRQLILRTLRDRGYAVLGASDAAEALSITDSHEGKIHLLLTDVVMPSMNGPELAARLRRSRPGVAVLYVSGHARDAIVHRGGVDEGVYLLPKPFNSGDLARMVRRVLDRPPGSR
jgi:two-component system cell cycle sensor histidine kinase/response regulator CckA